MTAKVCGDMCCPVSSLSSRHDDGCEGRCHLVMNLDGLACVSPVIRWREYVAGKKKRCRQRLEELEICESYHRKLCPLCHGNMLRDSLRAFPECGVGPVWQVVCHLF